MRDASGFRWKRYKSCSVDRYPLPGGNDHGQRKAMGDDDLRDAGTGNDFADEGVDPQGHFPPAFSAFDTSIMVQPVLIRRRRIPCVQPVLRFALCRAVADFAKTCRL